MSEEPRGAGMPEEPLHEVRTEPSPQEGEARTEPMAQGEQRKEEQERPEGAEALSRAAAPPESAEEAGKEAARPEGAEEIN